MDNNENQYITMMIEILEKQVKALNDMLDVTKQQAELADVSAFDEDKFGDTLSKKDVLIIRLNELDDGFVSVYDKVRRQVQSNPQQYKKEVATLQNLIRECTDIGNAIKTLEARNRDKLAACFADKKHEYSARQTAATVAGKYHKTMRNGFTGSGYRFNQDK